MTVSGVLRAGLMLSSGWLLVSCGDRVEVNFAQPFPAQEADMGAFPARYRAVYLAADSTTSFCVNATAAWQQTLRTHTWTLHQLDSLGVRPKADSTYRDDEGRRHHLRLLGAGSVRDSWLQCDTVFTLAGPNPGKLRRFQGRYYLNTQNENADAWQVQRLEMSRRHLQLQRVSTDTLQLLTLEPGSLRHGRHRGVPYFQLTPATSAQTRRMGRNADLWKTAGEFTRRH